MKVIRYDTETDGLLDKLTRVHCIVTNDGGPDFRRFHDDPDLPREGSIQDGLDLLRTAPATVAHNACGFDVPALQKVYPGWAPKGTVLDSAIAAAAVWPDEHRKAVDLENIAKGKGFPGQLVGRNSLESWGHRLGEYKADYSKDFSRLTLDMLTYCVQDVVVLDRLWKKIERVGISERALRLEHQFAAAVRAQIDRGFRLDRDRLAGVISSLMERRAELDADLADTFGSFTDVYFTPKKRLRREKVVPFNPNSRYHIARALRERHGWKPQEWTPTGQPKIDEAVLEELPYPEAQALAERFMLQKRLAQVAEGKQAWLKLVRADGRVHGYMAHNGAVTGRCTHRSPNMGQVPSVKKPWGRELRECWVPEVGCRLVVADASALEARILGHYATPYDGGELAEILLEGDVHARTMEKLDIDNRITAKRLFYGIIYGAQGPKVGKIKGVSAERGNKVRADFLRALPGLGRLVKVCSSTARSQGWLPGLDGRKLWVRKPHAALNTLIQGGGAIVMKQAVVNAQALPMRQVAFVHDEIVCEAAHPIAPAVAEGLREAIVRAGEQLNLRVPLDAHTEEGDSWAIKE